MIAMKYIQDTIVEYIVEQSTGEQGTYRFVLPSYPAEILLAIGENLDERLKRIFDRRINLMYGVAYRLGKQWVGGTASEKNSFLEIRSRGWYNEGDNLTSLRNILKKPEDDGLVVLLAGYDHIDDRASLQDFFHLDQEAIWSICLQRNFRKWVVDALRKHVNPEDSELDISKITGIFKNLYDYGLADLLAISKYLESMDFSIALSVGDAYKLILNNLAAFNLPCMIGLSKRYTNKGFHNYIVPAQEFFNYSMFIDESSRKKYKNRIDKYNEKSIDDQLDHEILGDFESKEALTDTLKDYIDNRTAESAASLQEADFVYIYDRIIGFRVSNAAPPKKARKLTGMPPEIFLRALWITLGDLKKEIKSSFFIYESLAKIVLRGLEFRHDFDAGADVDEDLDDKEIAHNFLCKILGGIDRYLEDQVRLQLGGKESPIDVILNSNLCTEETNKSISFRKSRIAEPRFKFEVQIHFNDNNTFKRDFYWPLPQHHQCRLLVDFYDWAFRSYLGMANALPVFSVPYMKEIFMSRDEEELNRLISTALQSKKCTVFDLIDAVGLDEREEVKDLSVNEMSLKYQRFLGEFQVTGFFSVLDNYYGELRKAYCSTFEKYLSKSSTSTFGTLLMKAFMVVSLKSGEDIGNWAWQEYLDAAVVTPLHPSVLEMVRHQHGYLCDSFCYYASNALGESRADAFSLSRWDRVADHSKIQWPIFGVLVNADKVLNTNMRSYNYLHLIGESSEEVSFVTSRLLMQYEDQDDEEITETDLFRETQSSLLIKQVLKDYKSLYSFADDGVSIGSYCGKEIQPVVAGIDSFLKSELTDLDRGEREYSLRLTIFSDSRDDSSVIRWINAWKERWQAAELSSGKQHYKNCRISISYRVVSRDKHTHQFLKLLQETSLDIMLFSDFIEAGASDYELLEQDLDMPDDYRKFPILEKVCCKVIGGGKEQKRERVLSNPRFRLGSLHSEVMAHLKKGPQKPSSRHAVVSQSDYQPWADLIDVAHSCSTWVVCIDPSIDEQQLQWSRDETVYKREIIGFGTGVGSHGENNFTISTEHFSMADIEDKISDQVSTLLGPWEKEECDRISENLIQYAGNVAGLSLVKATGPERYVRELIANAMVRKLLLKDETIFCDEIISLDAFMHWFDHSVKMMRPDLLRLRAKIIDGHFHINAQLIECKLAQESEGFLEKARQQIESGLRQLMSSFKPRGEEPIGIDKKLRPDQRYWWMQLHRLIASKGKTSMSQYKDTLLALERLSEGFFNITWQAAVVAFWNDSESSVINSDPLWDFTFENQKLAISVASAGKEFINQACLKGASGEIFASDSSIVFNCVLVKQTSDIKKEEDEDSSIKDESDEKDDDIQTRDQDKPVLPKKAIPDRILLGSGTAGGKEIFWEFGHPELNNRHILVFGASGTGKTYTIQALLLELSKAGQNSLIVDYTSGFTKNQLEQVVKDSLSPKQHIIRQDPLAVNPFRQQVDFVDDITLPENPASTAQRVSGVFSEIYQLGDQQKSALYSAIRGGIVKYGNDLNLNKLIDLLEDIKGKGGPTGNSAASVISKILPFVDMEPFGKEDPESWEQIFQDTVSRCHIIQLAGFVKDASRLITEFSLIDLYWYYRGKGSKDSPRVIVLDEIQNLDHRLESPLGQFLTEGRKFGISLLLATQTLSNLDKDERDRLFQASQKLFFKPADTEIRTYAQILGDATGLKSEEWVNRLTTLKRGECYSLGPALNTGTGSLEPNKYFRIKIKSLENRI